MDNGDLPVEQQKDCKEPNCAWFADQILTLVKLSFPELAKEMGYVKLVDLTRKDFLRLPIEIRREGLTKPAQDVIGTTLDGQPLVKKPQAGGK